MEWWDTFYAWMGTTQSANFAMWAGGLGTAGALIATLAAVLRERRLAQRAQANQLVARLSVMNTPYTPSSWYSVLPGSRTGDLNISNDSTKPVLAVSLYIVQRQIAPSRSRFRRLFYVDHIADKLMPSDTFNRRYELEKMPVAAVEWWLQFTDSSGRSWARDVVTGRLTTTRHINRRISSVRRLLMATAREIGSAHTKENATDPPKSPIG